MLSLPKLKILNFSVHYVVLHDSDSNFYITIISEEVAQLVIGFYVKTGYIARDQGSFQLCISVRQQNLN